MGIVHICILKKIIFILLFDLNYIMIYNQIILNSFYKLLKTVSNRILV